MSIAQPARPVIAWLGPAPPQGVLEVLGPLVEVRLGWSPAARLVVIWSPGGEPTHPDLPAVAPDVPILAAGQSEPTINDRLAWIEAGADDVVGVRALPRAILRRLARMGVPLPEVAQVKRTPPPFGGIEINSGTVAGQSVGVPAPVAEDDPFPALRVQDAVLPELAPIQHYVQALQRYLARREAWSQRHGTGALAALLELNHLRDQVPVGGGLVSRLNIFGGAAGPSVTSLDWPVVARRASRKAERGMLVSYGTMISVGSDGLTVEVDFRSVPRQNIVLDLPYDDHTNVQLMLEARMQRRVGERRWQIGALVLELRQCVWDR